MSETKKPTGKEGESKDAFADCMMLSDGASDGECACGAADALAAEMDCQEAEVTRKGVRRDVVKATLAVMEERVADRRADVMAIQGGNGNKRELLQDLVGDEMERVAEGLLSVPHYDPSLKTGQEIFLYVGTHWTRLDNGRYFQLVKKCCQRMGLPKAKVNNATFMSEVFHGVAYRFSGCWDKVSPPEGVARMNLQNGTLEVDREGNRCLCEHRKEDYFVNCLPFSYEEGAESPLWEGFLERVLPDAACQKVLREFVANALVSGAVKLDVMLILKGSGANGKSVLLEVLGALAGKENVSNLSLNDLTSDVVMRHSFEHKLLNTSSESESRWVPSVLKQLTSHEPVMVKELYHNPHEMTDYGYLIAAVNEMPRAEATDAFYRRLRILPFDATITPEEADPELATKLKGELPGILNWFLTGLPSLMKRKRLAACKVCEDELQDYRGATDYVYWFMEECCERSEKWEKASTLYSGFVRFCQDNMQTVHLTARRFYERLKSRRVPHCIKHKQNWFQLTLL